MLDIKLTRTRKFFTVSLVLIVLSVIASILPVEAQVDKTPELQWERFWGGIQDDYGTGLDISNGDIYVSGYTQSFGAGMSNALILRYNISGNVIWNKSWGGSKWDGGRSLHVSNDNIYVAGTTQSFANDPVGDLEDDTVILKYDLSGNLIWNEFWGNYPGYSGGDSFNDVIVVDNYIYAVGSSEFGWGNRAMLLQKYDTDGNLIWTKFWGPIGNGWPDGLMTQGEHLAVSENEIYSVGFTQSVMGAPYNAFVVKYDPEGNHIWNRTWGGTDDETAYAIAVSGTEIYVTGYTDSYGAGGHDAFILKYDSTGNLVWEKNWGGSEDEVGYDIYISDNSLYTVGSTTSFGNGYQDAFILKNDAEGNPVWNETWGGTFDDLARSIFVVGSEIYAVGETSSFGTGNKDVFLIKYNDESPDISISTDSFTYYPGDTMTVTLNISNPLSNPITLEWYVGIPKSKLWLIYASAPIPAGYSKTHIIPIPVDNWGPASLGLVHYAHLLDSVTGEVLAQNSATFAYNPGDEATSEVEIANQIIESSKKVELS